MLLPPAAHSYLHPQVMVKTRPQRTAAAAAVMAAAAELVMGRLLPPAGHANGCAAAAAPSSSRSLMRWSTYHKMLRGMRKVQGLKMGLKFARKKQPVKVVMTSSSNQCQSESKA